MSADALFERVRDWIRQDPDPVTRAEVTELAEAAENDREALAELHDRFDTRLAFGTAGLRGRLAGGPNRMNRLLVAQAAVGLGRYLREKAPDAAGSVVIGYDGRTNSDVFARDTAELLAGAGLRAILLPRMLPTPVLAFAVRHLGVSAGVMVTASHNPPRDNGYKVYLGGQDDGSQIVPPADQEIAAHILDAAGEDARSFPRSDAYEIAEESVVDAYVAETAAVADLIGHDPNPIARPDAAAGTLAAASELTVVYTAMHGVGWETAARVFDAAGYPRPHVVTTQIAPDAAFPTVSFPNPEEPGALDLSFATARDVAADLVIANDPDADRLAIAIPDPDAESGYRQLSGNDVGIMLGWMIGKDAYHRGRHGTLAASIVSSPALAAVAAAYGHTFVETLTGFKWISRADGLIFGFEEALGYLVNPETVRDKDGISAALAFLAMTARLKLAGLSVPARMDQFVGHFGAFASGQVSLRFDDVAEIGGMMRRLREAPPQRVGDVAVRTIDDLIDGFDGLPPSDVLRIRLEDGSRVIIRPSGTEPKLKVYLDASSDTGTVRQRRTEAESRVAALRTDVSSLLD